MCDSYSVFATNGIKRENSYAVLRLKMRLTALVDSTKMWIIPSRTLEKKDDNNRTEHWLFENYVDDMIIIGVVYESLCSLLSTLMHSMVFRVPHTAVPQSHSTNNIQCKISETIFTRNSFISVSLFINNLLLSKYERNIASIWSIISQSKWILAYRKKKN